MEEWELPACGSAQLLWEFRAGVPPQVLTHRSIPTGLRWLTAPLLLLGMIIGKCCTMPLSVWFLVVAGSDPSGSWRLCR